MLKKMFSRLMFTAGFLAASTLSAGCASLVPTLVDMRPLGIYVGAFGGINGGYNLNNEGVRTNRGYYFGLNAGKELFSFFRAEADVIWQTNDVHGLKNGSTAFKNVSGCINIGSVMANALFDFNFPFPGSPSLGAGVGYAEAEGHWKGSLTQTTQKNITFTRHKSAHYRKRGLAWQVIGDLNFSLSNSIKLAIEYRFFRIEGHHLSNHKFGLSLAKFF